jgi:hypothetical protein
MGAARLQAITAAGVAVVFLLLGFAVAQEKPAVQAADDDAVPTAEVVIVWAGGSPEAPPLPTPDDGAVDAITHATAEAGNIGDVAEKLGKELEAAGLTVLVITADDCRDPRTVMRAKAVVLASPDYFGMPAWQMVRFVDDTLYRIWRARVDTDVAVSTAFATTDRCLRILQGAVRSTKGKPVDGAVITGRGMPEEARAAAIKQLAERIVAGLQPTPATE